MATVIVEILMSVTKWQTRLTCVRKTLNVSICLDLMIVLVVLDTLVIPGNLVQESVSNFMLPFEKE